MPFMPLNLPPGVWRNGTQYQAKGHWFDANLMRFSDGTIRPWLGWNAHSATAVTGMARSCVAFTDPTNLPWVLVCTHSNQYVYTRSGAQTDITPAAGWTAGRADAVMASGYGGGSFGMSTYGDAHGGATTLQDASVPTVDILEGFPVMVMAEDGHLWKWDTNTASDFAVPAGSPTSNAAVFVTDEGFIFLLGAGGNPRKVQWPDQSSFTSWAVSTTSQAGSYYIATAGKLMCGVRLAGANLLFTTTDVHMAAYRGLPNIYEFVQVGTGCGIISRAAFAKAEGFVAWMSLTGFWTYNGETGAIVCEVEDDTFANLNMLQRSKVWALHNATYGEITWFYPRGVATEISHYVTWNYREKHWTNGTLARTCGCESGVFQWPIMVSTAGIVYQHENGLSYSGGTTPYLESGPLELGEGDHVWDIVYIEPDATTLGDVTATFLSKYHAIGVETSSAAYSLANPTDVRVAGRQHRLRVTSALTTDWRLGPATRLDVRRSGLR